LHQIADLNLLPCQTEISGLKALYHRRPTSACTNGSFIKKYDLCNWYLYN